MTRLEDIRGGAQVSGVVLGVVVEAVSVEWIGDQAINVVFRVPGGAVPETTRYRDNEPDRGHLQSQPLRSDVRLGQVQLRG